jgi:hypothetical protein
MLFLFLSVVFHLFHPNWTSNLIHELCNAPIFGFPFSIVGGDLLGLCQRHHRGKLRLTVSSGSLEELEEEQPVIYHISSS